MITTAMRMAVVMNANPPDEIPLPVAEGARAIDRSADTVRRYEREGRLPAIRIASGQRLFKRGDVERFLRERSR